MTFIAKELSKTLVAKLLGNCQTGREKRNKTRHRSRRESEKEKESIKMCHNNVYCEAGMPTEETADYIKRQNPVLALLKIQGLF
jgi:hypothetical protein